MKKNESILNDMKYLQKSSLIKPIEVSEENIPKLIEIQRKATKNMKKFKL